MDFLLNQEWGSYRKFLNFEWAEMKYLIYQTCVEIKLITTLPEGLFCW